jgi:hypothetical protein
MIGKDKDLAYRRRVNALLMNVQDEEMKLKKKRKFWDQINSSTNT